MALALLEISVPKFEQPYAGELKPGATKGRSTGEGSVLGAGNLREGERGTKGRGERDIDIDI